MVDLTANGQAKRYKAFMLLSMHAVFRKTVSMANALVCQLASLYRMLMQERSQPS